VQTLQASELKAKCLALMDNVAATKEVLVVTKNRKPIAELRPYSGGKVESPFGLRRVLRVLGDVVIVTPIAADDWKALT
jgi:antitoxin (DNA-binding transcriptional repressor) of toxin-antitoxin stability system